jgi:hypothetical protein
MCKLFELTFLSIIKNVRFNDYFKTTSETLNG